MERGVDPCIIFRSIICQHLFSGTPKVVLYGQALKKALKHDAGVSLTLDEPEGVDATDRDRIEVLCSRFERNICC